MTGSEVELAHAAHMPAPMGGALPTGLEWAALEKMAGTLAESDVIPYRLKRKPADVAVILLAAREYGIPPLMALSKLPVVNGTPAPMGELMVALVLRAGHSIRVTVEGEGGPWDQTVAICTTRRRGEDTDDVLRFSFREAITAGLVSLVNGRPHARDDKNRPTPWELYTVNMLRWRAVANACRLRFPDVLLGMSYLPEELGAVVDAEGAPVEGEVVAPRGAPNTGTIEQRTAQESADKLAEQPWHDGVLEAVRARAEADGYLDAAVTYHGDRMTLREALTRHVDDRTHADVVDADVVPEPMTCGDTAPHEPHTKTGDGRPCDGVAAPQEAATAPPAAEEAPTAPEATPTAAETPQEAAYDIAREALYTADAELLRSLFRGAGDLKTLDVLGVLGDDDLAALGAPPDLEALPLGALLIQAGGYVGRHGCAIRDAADPPATEAGPVVEDPPATFSSPEDPWAADAAAGWPAGSR
jgi:hypothetical protein